MNLFPLEWFIGETLAEAMCRDDNDLEMVRLWRMGTGEHVIVQKQINRISVWIDSKTWPTKQFENGCDTQDMQYSIKERR